MTSFIYVITSTFPFLYCQYCHHRDLPDNPNGAWPSEIIGRHIVRVLSQYNIHRVMNYILSITGNVLSQAYYL